jgi:hypothetical protein
MRSYLIAGLLLYTISAAAQRPATRAEHDEDARVLKILSQAMPHNLEGAAESERSDGSSNINGLTGFYNNTNFSTRDIFQHQYTITYEYSKAPDALKEKIETAKNKNNLKYVFGSSFCEIQFWVNSNFTESNFPYSLSPVKKINTAYCSNAYRDESGSDFTFLFFGNNWSVSPSSYMAEDENGKPQKRFFLKTTFNSHSGTIIQGILVYIQGNADLADIILKQVDWKKINGLIGTGDFKDDESEGELKKYFAEKAVPAVAGINTFSFTMVAEDGATKDVVISSSKHDRSNCVRLRNHNENPKLMQDVHMDFYITDDTDPNLLFMLSLPIIRTTGTVTATFDSDYDYQVMWRGNTDANHSFSPVSIEIHLSKWVPVGDFLEGTFSGTATLKDHNNFSTEVPKYTIKNGKFRLRRINDEMQ